MFIKPRKLIRIEHSIGKLRFYNRLSEPGANVKDLLQT